MGINFPEHFTDTQKEISNSILGLAIMGTSAAQTYGALDVMLFTLKFATEFSEWIVRQGVVSEEEMIECVEFSKFVAIEMANQAREAKELENLFAAPAFGEEEKDDSEGDSES